jgi:GNAT superfamily N-acetyltransferase
MTAVIRAARSDELAELHALALRSKAHWGYDDAFMAACSDELRVDAALTEAGRVSLAVAGPQRRVVGFATLEGTPPQGALGMLFIDPDAIGLGIGRLLFRHILAQAAESGFERLTIDSDPHAEPFYLAMGAKRIGSTPSGSIPGRELPLMAVEVG